VNDIKIDAARRIISGALRLAEHEQLAPLAIVVLDRGGHVKAFERADGASNLRFQISFGKAYGALGIGIGSRALMAGAEKDPAFISALNGLFGGALVPVPGGVLVRTPGGELVGAVGVSGDNSDNDEKAAIAGIESVGLTPDAG
jgi:uncharacterized protein GlcG (DUF336 family)